MKVHRYCHCRSKGNEKKSKEKVDRLKFHNKIAYEKTSKMSNDNNTHPLVLR